MKKIKVVGLQKGEVKLFSYTPEWKKLYKQEEKLLYSSIGKYIENIQHIGSTAIPGVFSKPIIDIAIAVKPFKSTKEIIGLLRKLGYEYKGDAGVLGRLFFVKEGEAKRTHHLHFIRTNSRDWKNALLFRDYLQEHKDVAREYSNLKKELAKKFPIDRESYSSGKAKFIMEIINKKKSGSLKKNK